MNNRLYRSRKDAMIGGVCGGLAQYLAVDPSLVRIFFLILLFGTGFGLIIYLILWLVIPQEDPIVDGSGRMYDAAEYADRAINIGGEVRERFRNPNPAAARYFGIGLIIAGVIFLLQNLNLPYLAWLRMEILWPAILILGGIALVIRAVQKR